MKLTLDWNCVIEVEERRAQAEAVRMLVTYHRNGRANVALLATSASENSKSKRFPGNAKLFNDRVAALGWTDLPIVRMPMIIGLSYWGFSYWVKNGQELETERAALWSVLAPQIERDPHKHLKKGQVLTDEAIQSEELSQWRNSWCDVMSAYCHIKEGRDVFVTNNLRDFQKNAGKLAALGMKSIMTPIGSAEYISLR